MDLVASQKMLHSGKSWNHISGRYHQLQQCEHNC